GGGEGAGVESAGRGRGVGGPGKTRWHREALPPPLGPRHSASKTRVNALSARASLSPLTRTAYAGRGSRITCAINKRAVIFLPETLRCAGESLPSHVPLRLPPESRSWPFPAILGGAVPTWSRRPNANTLARSRGIPREMLPWRAASGWSCGFLGQTPELKSLGLDCSLDRIAREIMRRSLFRTDGASGGPRTMLLWKSAAREVASEGLQTFPRLRLENVNSHGSILS